MAGKQSYTNLLSVAASYTAHHWERISSGDRQYLNDRLILMPDEPRRSGRATKGQHKNLELPDAPSKKGKGKSPKEKSGSKASAEPTPGPSEDGDEEEIIRCICGEYEEEEDVERDMICCDQCSAWQHNDCMGLVFPKGAEPDQYYCEQCRPENHKVLLDKIAKGEKPWEEVAERRRQEAEEKKSKRKKGKKGSRKSRPGESKTEASTPARAGTSATPGPTPGPAHSPTTAASASAEPEKNGHTGDSRRSSTNKRKLEDSAEAETDSGPQVKQQRFSPPAAGPKVKTESPAVATVEELVLPARKSAANALIKFFVDQVAAAQKNHSFSLPEGQSADDTARLLGLSVEGAMYQNLCEGTGEPTEAYKSQLRAILFNVKKNPSLRDRLLVGSVSSDTLSMMKSEDMASEELQRKDAEIKREAERQHMIIQEQGPRIRRTHKGEELIEDETHNVAAESVFSTVPRRPTDTEGSPGNQSPATPKISQRGDGHGRGHSPDGGHGDHVFPEVATNIREPMPRGTIQADAEIDRMLQEDEVDSPPYSPQEFDEGVVWRGRVTMAPVAEFSSTARHVCGAELSGRIPWSQLAPETLLVDGRIDVTRANNYLCGLRWSLSTDVSVIGINSPNGDQELEGFNKLFDYFYSRQRYGVIGKHPLAAVKDTYIVPLEKGTTTLPDFINLLENTNLGDGPIEERLLLVVFVVKTGDSNPTSVQPPSHQPSLEPAASASPLTAAGNTPQHAFAAGQNPAYNSTSTGPQVPHTQVLQHALPHYQNSLHGMPAALHVLGAQNVNSPAIQKLLQTAPNVDVAQLNVVRDILIRQPAAAADYETLMQALFDTQANGHA
ncbi:Zinc finger PHD-type [Penicillium odoratum]|uniref:Zinc finger PHD-type n=1 Tax=Penicillium odoratum TaxID=1167516 RepID=UPI002546C72A|nr:Zinc finger PHD-type [Penicillium odoratum]KAJ5759451.1 Zinc finger PHD-type [Penicillium odoratum]